MSTFQPRHHGGATRALAILLAITLATPLWASPGEINTAPAMGVGAVAPAASDIKAGDASVSTQTGSFQYTYPISVPPGRLNMQPSLALSYSSQAPIYGGIAAGWTLDIPEIRRDTFPSILTQDHGHLFDSERWRRQRFVSSLAGGRPLVEVDEPTSLPDDALATYRAQNDEAFDRYERLDDRRTWRVRSHTGVTHYFGEPSRAPFSSSFWAPLTRTVDAHGNTVEYIWSDSAWAATNLQRIRYTSNPDASPALPSFAEVELDWEASPVCTTSMVVGQFLDSRLGLARGVQRLAKITVTAHVPGDPSTVLHTRRITLGYDVAAADCAAQHGPINQLISIQESAWGNDAPVVDLPAVTFEYNRLARTFDEMKLQAALIGSNSLGFDLPEPGAQVGNLGGGTRRPSPSWPSVDTMMLDFDGDGLQDRLYATTDGNACMLSWQKNLGRNPTTGNLVFEGSDTPINLPRLPWGGADDLQGPAEWCSLSAQFTLFANHASTADDCTQPTGSYLAYRWLDMTGDGLPDLVTGIHQDPFFFDPALVSTTYPVLGGWPACDATQDLRCAALDAGCVLDTAIDCGGTGTSCDFGDELSECEESAPRLACGVIARTNNQILDGPCFHGCLDNCFGCSTNIEGQNCHPDECFNICDHQCTAGDTVDPGFNPPIDCERKGEYQRCGGYPWMIYENTGGGLATTPMIRYQPIPVESDNGDSSFGGGYMAGTNRAVQDIDGDGNLDAIIRGRALAGTGATMEWFEVFPGDGHGRFKPYTWAGGEGSYVWHVPPHAPIALNCASSPGVPCNALTINPGAHLTNVDARGLSMLVDLTGDGAADLVWKAASDQFDVRSMPPPWTPVNDPAPMTLYPNDGRRFLFSGPLTSPRGWPLSNPASAYLSRSHFNSTAVLGQFPTVGTSTAKSRLFDVDDDGRLDLLAARWDTSTPPGAWGPMALYINGGGSFLTSSSLSSADQSKLTPETKVDDTGFGGPREHGWAMTKDLVDLDGDGLLEAWSFAGSYATYYRDSDRQPLRLLKHIDNGRGGSTDITYAASTDPATVEQDAGLHKAMPAVMWVVASTTTKDQWDTGNDATTSYAYRYPVWNKDDDQRWGFRGFEEVTTTKPSGGRVVTDYGYIPDWRGKAILARMYGTEDPTNPRTITEEVWTELPLFAGAISTFHPAIESSWTCATGQTEAACIAADAGLVVKTTTWDNHGGQLWAIEEGETRDSATYDAGDRRSSDEYQLVSDDVTYRLQHTLHTERVSTDGDPAHDTLTNYQTTTYDPVTGDLTAQSQYFAADLVEHADTTFAYDLGGSGVRVRLRRPEQQPSGLERTYAYDPTKRFVVSEANELGHAVTAGFEPGTGAQIWSEGPNWVSCGTGCTNVQKTWTDIDGLGRPIATYVNRAVSGLTSWAKTKTAAISYRDGASGPHPGKLVEHLIDYDAARWSREETEVDGRGRPTRVITRTGGSTPDAVTSTDYDPSGNVVAVTTPDPSASAGYTATVSTTYGYDSLGRPTWTRRPAAVGAASGLDVIYDGLTVRSDDVTGARGGVAARKVVLHDRFGRMSEVREYTNVGTGAYATTSYQYDARDAVSRIESADGAVTQLTHDFGGRRTKIVRGGRTWDYTYDDNGNLLTVASPPPGSTSAALYTMSYAYDAIDRPTSRSDGGRDLSLADRTLFGVGMITFGYDSCVNGVGQLCTVTLPGSHLTTTYGYDAEGNQASESRTFNFGGVTGTRAIARAYGPDRRVAERTFADNAISSTAKTRARYSYDDRLLPESVAWLTARSLPSPDAPRTVASQTRNVAGQVLVRSASLAATPGTSGWRDLSSTWTYDELGHPTSQIVADSGTVQYSRQALTYFGLDDPKTLQHVPGSTSTPAYNFAYTYDARHQLTVVSEGAGKFTAGYSFTTGGKLLSANVSATNQTGGTVINRNVTYNYSGSVDPEAVSALVTNGTATALRAYSYDRVGNATARYNNGASTPTDVFLYDGEDHLRRARKFSGATLQGTEEYYYDHDGQRAAVVTRAAAGSVSGVRVFIGGTEIELSGSGTMTKAYANLELGTPVGRVVSPSGGWTAGSTAILPTNLELSYQGLSSNAILSLQPNGTIYAAFVYGPYGEVIQATGSGVSSTRVRFNSKFRDSLTTLHYYGARYYDDLSLTWTQADPKYRVTPDAAWGSPRRANLYSFTVGNPLRYLDPDGKDVYIILITSFHGDYFRNADTLKRQIEGNDEFDPKKDIVLIVFVPDLGTLGGVVKSIVDGFSQKYGYTAELAVFGHATGLDGPRGEVITSAYRQDQRQLSGDGWRAINFNWKPDGQSRAYFYGCRAFTWVNDTFVVAQPEVGWAAGWVGWTYPSSSEWKHVEITPQDPNVYTVGTTARTAGMRESQTLTWRQYGADYTEAMRAVRPADGVTGHVSPSISSDYRAFMVPDQ